MYSIKQVSRKLQNFASTNTDLENHVRELTNTDAWGPTSQQLFDLNAMILQSAGSDFLRITKPPLRMDDLPKPEHIATSSKIIFHLVNRIYQYSEINARYFSFQKLRLYLNNEKPPMFENYGSHKIYDSIKKNYINQGLEYRIIAKSLTALEYLLINAFQEGYDIKSEIASYKQYIDQVSKQYMCHQAQDHRMQFHTDTIRSKCQHLLLLLSDSEELQQKRKVNHKVATKINRLTPVPALSTTRNRPGRSISWSRYNNVDKLGLQLDEDYGNEELEAGGAGYNDQDLAGYYKDIGDTGYNDQDLSHVYDEMPDDDYLRSSLTEAHDAAAHDTAAHDAARLHGGYNKEDNDDDEEEFGELQTAKPDTNQISNEFDLLDLSDADHTNNNANNFNPSTIAAAAAEMPLSPSTGVLNFNTGRKKEYVLANAYGTATVDAYHVPKTTNIVAPTTTGGTTTVLGGPAAMATATVTPSKGVSVFDDLFKEGKQRGGATK